MGGNRRMDRVLDPDLSERLDSLETAGVRSLRDDCREEESRLSYLRRLLHARLDIARAEVARRGGGDEDLLGRLPQILSEHSGAARGARSVPLYSPESDAPNRRVEDQKVDDPALWRLPELGDEELAILISDLAEQEREVSSHRATVLENLDRLQAELVARYRDGRATIDEVLSGSDGSST